MLDLQPELGRVVSDARLRQLERAYGASGLVSDLDAWEAATRQAGLPDPLPAVRLRTELELRLAQVLVSHKTTEALAVSPHAPKPMMRANFILSSVMALNRIARRAKAWGMDIEVWT